VILDQWQTAIALPSSALIETWLEDCEPLREEISTEYMVYAEGDIRSANGIMFVPGIGTHEDEGNLQFSSLLVLRNDGFLSKGEAQPDSSCIPQTPGTALILDIHQPHHCLPENGNGWWIAAFSDWQHHPSREEVEVVLRTVLQRLGV